MAGIFAGHVKTWFYSANKPDEDLNSPTEPADGSVTTSMKYNPTRTVDLVEAGRAAVAAGLPAVAFLSADDVTGTVGRPVGYISRYTSFGGRDEEGEKNQKWYIPLSKW